MFSPSQLEHANSDCFLSQQPAVTLIGDSKLAVGVHVSVGMSVCVS